MFTILVRFEGKSGKYPVIYTEPGLEKGRYIVSARKYHDHDNFGSVLTAESVAKLMPQLLGMAELKSVEIQTA